MVMQCEQVWREISNYLEGDVESSLRAAMDDHFRTCARCRSVLEGTRNIVQLYSDERMIEVPAGFGRRLERRLAQNVRAINRRPWSTWSAWLVPAAALALITGGIRLANSSTSGQPLLSQHAQQAHNVPPDMLVVVSADAKVFHRPGCDFIHNKDKERTLTAKEAMQEGYIPCLRCMRKYLDTASLAYPSLNMWTRALPDLDDDSDEGGQ